MFVIAALRFVRTWLEPTHRKVTWRQAIDLLQFPKKEHLGQFVAERVDERIFFFLPSFLSFSLSLSLSLYLFIFLFVFVSIIGILRTSYLGKKTKQNKTTTKRNKSKQFFGAFIIRNWNVCSDEGYRVGQPGFGLPVCPSGVWNCWCVSLYLFFASWEFGSDGLCVLIRKLPALSAIKWDGRE